MSDQPENEMQQTVTPEEVREAMLAELDASKQTIEELSDEELESIAGAGAGWEGVKLMYGVNRRDGHSMLKSAVGAVMYGPKVGKAFKDAIGIQDKKTMKEYIAGKRLIDKTNPNTPDNNIRLD